MTAVEAVSALAGVGLSGDRYAAGLGTYSGKRHNLRHLTLISAEAIRRGNARAEVPFTAAETRRNLVVDCSPEDLLALVEKELTVGPVKLRGVEDCVPCKLPSSMAGKPGFFEAFTSLGGLRAEILSSGTITVGDQLLIPAHRPQVGNSAGPTLQRAVTGDAPLVLSWAPTKEQFVAWCGPSVRWPATPESFWTDIDPWNTTVYKLLLPEGDMVAFGQVGLRNGQYGHLTRIIVSPQHRGRDFGRLLCQGLMREGLRLHPGIAGFSLFVDPANAAAVGLYRSLEFTDTGTRSPHCSVLMVAPVKKEILGST